MSLKVAVIMGGNSDEKNVSLKTGQAVQAACNMLGYDTRPVILRDDYRSFFNDLKDVDIVFNALHGGEGENGEIQLWFEANKIKYTGSNSSSSHLCMDKSKSKELVKGLGLKTPKWENIKNIDSQIKLKPPYVIKPNDQGSTVGITIVNKMSEVRNALVHAFSFGNEIMVEEFINGREITVSIIGEQVYPIVEIEPKKKLYDYECKYKHGMSYYTCPAEIPVSLTNDIKNSTMDIFKRLGCRVYGRADFLLVKDEYFFLEMNTLPGLTDTSLLPKAAAENGLDFPNLIKKIIQFSI